MDRIDDGRLFVESVTLVLIARSSFEKMRSRFDARIEVGSEIVRVERKARKFSNPYTEYGNWIFRLSTLPSYEDAFY